MNTSKFTRIIILLALSMMMGACSSGTDAGTEDKRTLYYGSDEITSINPVLYEHGEINGLIFGGLMKHGEGNVPVVHLAEGYSLSEDERVYDFTLRRDVLWHDGEAFTAEDVQFTLEAIMNKDNGSEIASNYEEIEEILVLDEYQIRIRLTSPNAAMLDYLCIGIVPKHILEGKDLSTHEFNRHPIGTGPYRVKDFTLGEAVTLEANEAYFNGQPEIERIVFRFTADSKTRSLQLKAKEIDLSLVAPEDASQFQGSENHHVIQMNTADYRGILYNFASGFFSSHRELPNILSYGIDRQAMVDSVLLGYGESAYSPLQKSSYVHGDIEKFSYDPIRVKEELKKNNWVMGADGIYVKGEERLSFTINCMENDETRIKLALIASQQLKAQGVEVHVHVAPEIDWANQEAFLIGWGSPYDPDDHTYKVFGTDKGSNYSAYENETVHELLTKARGTSDVAERRVYYTLFQEELTKDLPFTFLVYMDALYVVSDQIEGIDREAVLGHHGVGIFINVEEWTWKE